MTVLQEKEIGLILSIEEGKIIIEALAELPFRHVFELIGKINSQANKKNSSDLSYEKSKEYRVNMEDVEIMVTALGHMPFIKVENIMGKLGKQIKGQINS